MSPNKSQELREAFDATRPYLRRAGVFSVAAGLLSLSSSAYMLSVYDRVLTSRSILTLGMLLLAVLAAYAVLEVVEWARGEILHEAGEAFERSLARRVFDVMFTINLQRPGSPTAQPLADLKTLRDAYSSPVSSASMEAPVALVYLVLIFAISPVLGWVAVVGAVLQTGIGWMNERSTRPSLVASQRESMAAQQYADGTLRNAEVIEAMGMLPDVHQRWQKKQRQFLDLQAVASTNAGKYQAITKFVQMTLSSALLGLAAWLMLHDSLNGGGAMLVISSILGARMLQPLVQIVTQWRTVVLARDAWTRLSELLDAKPARGPSMSLPPPKGMLTVEQVTAGAPGMQAAILRNVSFGLASGQVLAVVGPSASGKTTLARLLVGIWPAAAGKVRLDGADVFGWDKAELGPYVGYLPQDVELFEGTLAENIARFGAVDMEKVEAAARSVGLHDLITQLPGGYDSPIGDDGAMLSGGQRQRVALARALYGDPALVVLDEPNSSLDESGDAALASAIRGLKERGTTFVIMTHRTSVLAVADRMLVLHDGVAQAFGPRDEVLAALAKAAAAGKAKAAEAAAAGAALPATPARA
ncbi:type I secretion system permease/ATPase [Ramlibacter sp. PS4R-6]|uniref:type I secretion system permease/ATPase n=1 Tax=Ramlibacter sp. PS4R-6 TaxID=3133438 RepID=UPI0030B0A449